MTTEQLSQSLSKLHAELSNNPELDQATLQALKGLLEEIQLVIDRAVGDAPLADQTRESALPLGQKLQSAIGEFEARHPRLTLTLSQIADGLNAMGI